MTDLPLYLASTSPRRRRLLAEAGIAFEQYAVSVDEDALTDVYDGPLGQLGEYLARAKAQATFAALQAEGKRGVVLAADTTVLIDERSLAKPRHHGEGTAMLLTLRGREHIVATGIAVAGPAPESLLSATAATRVRMRAYSDEEIARYVVTGDSLDKAGGYSLQHPQFAPVERIAGCHLGVIGLPVCLVTLLLAQARGEPRPDTHETQKTQTGECPWSGACRLPFPWAASERSPARQP